MNGRESRFTAVTVLLVIMQLGSLHAQVDPSGQWRTWHTAHFRVHARAELSTSAVLAAEVAEHAYALLSRELKPPRGTIDLVLSDDVDFSNGFASFFPSNRMTVYLAPPGDPSVSLASYDEWLRLVVTHELAHVFHLDRADGVWRVLQTLFGRAPGLFPNAYQPSWVHEGLATYYESRLTDAGRLRGGFHEQLLRAAAREDEWPSPGDAVFTNPIWPGGFRPYAWGSRFFDLASTTVHDSVIAAFVDRTSRQLIPVNVSGPLRPLTGEPVDALWARLRDRANSGRLSEPGSILVRGLRSEPLLRLSEDESRVAYRLRDDRNVQRVVVDRLDGETIASHRANDVQGLGWVGDELHVTQLEFTSPVTIASDLYRWRPGGSWQRVLRGSRVTDVFGSSESRTGVIRLMTGKRVLMTLGEGQSFDSYPAPPAADWGRVALSPDGRWVAAARHADERWDITLWPVGRPQELRLVTADAALDADPSWSAEGRLLFVSERTGLPQVYGYDLATERTEQLTNVTGGAREPALMRDGTLLYSTMLADGFAIVADTRVQPVETSGATARFPPTRRQATSGAPPPRESGYAPWPSLVPRYWIPLAHDEGEGGVFIGMLTTGVDVVGRTQYGLFASVAPGNGRVEAVASLAHSRWRSWRVDATAGQTWDFAGFASSAGGVPVPVSFRERSGEVGVQYRWRRWRSGFAARVGSFVEQDALVNDGSEPLNFTPANRTFAGGVLSLSASRVERPALAISPENGISVGAIVLRRWQVGGPGWSHEVRAAVNGYLAIPLPGFAHWVLAGRASAGITGGPTPTVYSVGGVSGDIVDLVPGYTLGSGRRKFPLRGYARGTERFTRAAVGVIELRVPVVAVGKGLWKLPLLLDRVSLATFVEAGGGWNAGEPVRLTRYRDVGGESIFDLGIGNVVSLRIRAGAAVALADGLGSTSGDARAYVTVGSSF